MGSSLICFYVGLCSLLLEVMVDKKNRMCTRCVFDDTVRNIKFDRDGVCHFCHVNQKLSKKLDKTKLDRLLEKIKHKMQYKKFDCIVPFSGGIDSTYVLYYVKKAGLRPIAVHSDNGWVADISRQNMERAVEKLAVPLVSLSKDWKIMKDVYLAALKASVPDLCLACEVKSISEIMEFSAGEGIPYIFFGFSPRTEGLVPLSWHYVDSRYFNGIIRYFSENKKAALKLNKINIFHFFYFSMMKSIRHILLPSYVDWDEQKIKTILEQELDWIDYGHHSDCLYHPVARYIVKKKFNIDREKTRYCARINAGRMSREDALRSLQMPYDESIESKIDYVLEKLGIARREFERLCSLEPRYFTNYPSYYSLIKRTKYLLWLASKIGLIADGLYDYYFNTG